jgi:hypothetical protein
VTRHATALALLAFLGIAASALADPATDRLRAAAENYQRCVTAAFVQDLTAGRRTNARACPKELQGYRAALVAGGVPAPRAEKAVATMRTNTVRVVRQALLAVTVFGEDFDRSPAR